ncbi:helix-turn-helix domain-containing protein [Sneathiella glossodoripedis]|uniref:helix-turn-helix domain-containing protein n=1 Tax=Sneathiella glossodoripedis TaxID=418853 RepID=UPI00046EE075|nr:helix-turn-helix transcriptional regulator [Sneathiella glossodoripedis]
MQINSNRLRELRKLRKLTHQTLAKAADMSPRQISRLEKTSRSVREGTLYKLAKALNVEPGVLLNELPMPKPKVGACMETGKRVQVSAQLLPEVRLAYALVKRRYGVNPTTLFNAAPLLFTLLAEDSTLSRTKKVQDIKEAAEQLSKLGVGNLSFTLAASRIEDGVKGEEASIQNNDLFGTKVSEDSFDFGYDQTKNNPFADFLRKYSREINSPGIVDIDDTELAYGPLENFPIFEICADDLEQISGGCAEASYALTRGHARIGDIPDELWSDDAVAKRVQWLKEQIPENERNLFTHDFLDSIDLTYDDNKEIS